MPLPEFRDDGWLPKGHHPTTFFAAAVRKFPHLCRLDVFDHDKDTGTPKGVVEVTL